MSERLEADDPVARKAIRAAGNRETTRRSPQGGDCNTDTLALDTLPLASPAIESSTCSKFHGPMS